MKNLKLKKYAAFAAALTMTFSMLTACGGSTSVNNASDNSRAVSESEGNTTAEVLTNKTNMEYQNKLFDSSYVHTIDISISDENWFDLTENPLEKNKYEINITIDGETLNSVSLSTKGNTSLSSVSEDENNRYSFKVNCGKYVEGQTYYGLSKFSLNNLYADATYMKDYLSYEIFRQTGIESPLVSYVWLTVNGEEQGLYIAIEDISESYLNRTENGEGELYKPETEMFENMGKMGKNFDGEGFDFSNGEFEMPEGFEGMTPPDGEEKSDSEENSENKDKSKDSSDSKKKSKGKGNPDGNMPNFGNGEMPNFEGGEMPDFGNGDMPDFGGGEMPDFGNGEMPDFGGGGMPDFGGNSNGADLAYSDDNIESYSDILDNDVTDADDDAKQRVITALKGLSEGENLEEYLDTGEIIRYFAAHNFVLNYDSYTGSMLHNYFLYEKDGKLSMLPWDYNLAFGGFGGGGFGDAGGFGGDKDKSEKKDSEKAEKAPSSDATSLINTGIDTPLSGASEESRPMWSWIADNEEYLEKYHQVYDELLTNYFESGEFEKQIDAIYEMILPYVEKETNGFYTTEEFKKGYETLKKFCLLRAESIRKQLNGELSADTDKQSSDAKVSAESINIDDLGKQNGGPDGEMKMPFGKNKEKTEE